MAAVIAGALSLCVTAAFASTWSSGDVFVGVEGGNYNVYSNAGVFKETITAGSSYTTGCAFNNDQTKLFTTYFGNGNVETFDTVHPHASALFAGGISTPESVVFDKLGNVYVSTGNSGGGFSKYSSSGTLLAHYTPSPSQVDWIDLAADQKTIFYTGESTTIHRFDVSTNTQLPDFASTGSTLYALRILPDGGVLVANTSNILRYNAAGTVIQTYDRAGNDSWFALNLDPNGTSFWSGDFSTADVVKFNIATGAVENNFNTGTGNFTVFGLCLKGEITVGGGDTTKPTCTLAQTLSGPPAQIKIDTRDTGSGLASIQVLSSSNVTVSGNTGFTVGTTATVQVTATKVNQSLGSSVKLRVTDVAGNFFDCDPVLAVSIRDSGQPSVDTYSGLPQAESKVTVTNGNPGVKNLELTVNGQSFKVNGLADNAVAKVDVSSAMHAGNDNTITVTARGKPGATAFVVISD